MSKKQRLSKILEIINEKAVETQGELTSMLIDAGYDVTQATVSRDIKELHLIKIIDYKGRYRYALPGNEKEVDVHTRFITVLKHVIITVQTAVNLVVIKTIAGSAQACAMAVETMNFENVVGVLAGDDTVFIAMNSADDARELMEKICEVVD